MSSIAALMLLTAGTALPPPPPLIGATQAMANYHALVDGAAPAGGGGDRDCPVTLGNEITVCARGKRPSPRLPLPVDPRPQRVFTERQQQAAADWEARLGCRMGCDPTQGGQAVSKLMKILRGEDPD